MGNGIQLGHAWFGGGSPQGAPDRRPHATYQAMQMLAFLRVFAPVAQALTLIVVVRNYQVHMPLEPVVATIAVEVLVAIATWARLAMARPVSGLELLAQVHLDILMFAAVLFYTGGATNPFAPLFVLPIAIAAPALGPRAVWVTALSTMVAYVALRVHHVALSHPDGMTEVYDLHEDGMVVNYLFIAGLMAFFCNRMHHAARVHESTLADARDAQMRSESVVAIGALAAGYAHELSTPLSTMAVVVAELKCEHAANRALKQDLDLVDDQIRACKQIISNLASAGGKRRAETAVGSRLDFFIHSIIGRARDLHPDATIVTSIDSVTPPPFVVAEETLRQAITNLIVNAIHVCAQHVEVDADWAGADLRVTVRDRGPGFGAELLAQIGRTVETTKGAKGTGLGLLLSAATLERLGGQLLLTNQPEGGARAEIRLPLDAIRIRPPTERR